MSAGQNDALVELAQRAVAAAMARGASAAECVIRTGRDLSVAVRLGETESIKQAEGKALGLRVFRGQQSGVTHSSDLAWPAVESMIVSALAIADASSADPCAGLPDAAQLGRIETDLGLYSPAAAAVTAEQALEWARTAERAALDCDPRLSNSDGASFDTGESWKVFVNSLGFCDAVQASSSSLSVVPIAVENGGRQRDYWYTVGRAPAALESPESVGRTAAQRTLRRLGARKPATAQVPILFDPQAARSLLGHMLEAVSGETVYRQASFLAGQLGNLVASPLITVVDDGATPGALGSTPFDGEGLPSRRTPVITAGRLESYLLNCYTARKLGMASTANARRGLAGAPGVGCGNLTLAAGGQSLDAIIAGLPRALLVTEFMGFGVNLVTGDYSRGATGLWIENGEIAYPVEECTVAGNLREMLCNITAVGNDLVLRGAVNSPTLLVEGMTVAGR